MPENVPSYDTPATWISTLKPEDALSCATGIRAIVFDLDGTLYASKEYASAIQECAVRYIATLLEMDVDRARQVMGEARKRLADERGQSPALSAVCCSLGGTIQGLHVVFRELLQPELYLKPDDRVIALLRLLSRYFELYLYTNNNRVLTARIIAILGIDGFFSRMFAVEDFWRPKPDHEALERVMETVGLPFDQALFVGDRYSVDLWLPEQMGAPVYLSTSVEQLLRLQTLVEDNAVG